MTPTSGTPNKSHHVSYSKPWKSYADQLDQLIARGMAVTHRARALDSLERIGYYRLSGYWFAFRERSEPLCLLDEHGHRPKRVREERMVLDTFRDGTTFQDAVDLYVFDKQLRLLVMDALERIEVALRVDVSHTLGRFDRFELAWVAPFEADTHARARCFLLLRITRHLLDVVNPRSSWSNRIKRQLLDFPDLSHVGLNMAGTGAPGGWEADW